MANNAIDQKTHLYPLDLSIISFNMHGYNQGLPVIQQLIASNSPDLLLVQEHWLTPANLCKFNVDLSGYQLYGISAMSHCVEAGPLIGRPFGGVATLVKRQLLNVVKCIHTSERYVIIKVGELLIVNVYLPCDGTVNRTAIYSDVLNDVLSWRVNYAAYPCIIGGDFNIDLDIVNPVSCYVNKVLRDNMFDRCDKLFGCSHKYTYVNENLQHFSKLDYFVYSNVSVSSFDVLEPDINFSDHLPILMSCTASVRCVDSDSSIGRKRNEFCVEHFRWDHADLSLYYCKTQACLQPILTRLIAAENDPLYVIDSNFVDELYNHIVQVLQQCALVSVPRHRKNFFKFWWSQELDTLKECAIVSHRLWTEAGRPRVGPIYEQRNKDRRTYRAAIRRTEHDSAACFTNDLHEALLNKQGIQFWQCWNSKFENKSNKPTSIDGLTDDGGIADMFAQHFAKVCKQSDSCEAAELLNSYTSLRSSYVGAPYTEDYKFDAECVEQSLVHMKRGKAAGLDNLTTEHLTHCHPSLMTILAKLFNFCFLIGYVPKPFGLSYTVPLLKGSVTGCSKNLSASDFRGISISPVLSKLFEHCVLRRFVSWFTTRDNQFGFKQGLSTSHAIYNVRRVVDYYVSNSSTVNVCAIDVSKAFDSISHYGLLIEMMHRNVPVNLLNILEDWFGKCKTCVRWGSAFSDMFRLSRGVRQGGVLSPHLFAIYIDDIINVVENTGVGCRLRSLPMCIILYADDILLLAPSVTALQTLVLVCEAELRKIDLYINATKSVCLRIGPRCDNSCCPLVAQNGQRLSWETNLRYLGVFIRSSRQFKCLYDNAKRKFYSAFNAIYGKIGRTASEEVTLSLISAKCLPCLLYATEACPLNRSEIKSLGFPVTRVLYKMFKTGSSEVIRQCQDYFNFPDVEELIRRRKLGFGRRFSVASNSICQTVNSLFAIA